MIKSQADMLLRNVLSKCRVPDKKSEEQKKHPKRLGSSSKMFFLPGTDVSCETNDSDCFAQSYYICDSKF
eukprot:3827043-Amphidinium_carterae.1